MLVAKDYSGNIVNLLSVVDSEVYRHQELYCPACASPVRLKKGAIKMPHFAHVSKQACMGYSENESLEHLTLKRLLYQWANQDHEVLVEQYLPALKQTPDLLINQKLVIEIQCSPLSMARLIERTSNYHQEGYEVLWLLGEKLQLTDKISHLQYGFVNYSPLAGCFLWGLSLKSSILSLKYLIHEDLKGNIYCKERQFAFFEGDLLACLRTPYLLDGVEQLYIKEPDGMQAYFYQQLAQGSKKWLAIQECLYLARQNLLTTRFATYVYPLGARVFEGQADRVLPQVRSDIATYYQNYQNYHKNQDYFRRSPTYYDTLNIKKGDANGEKKR